VIDDDILDFVELIEARQDHEPHDPACAQALRLFAADAVEPVYEELPEVGRSTLAVAGRYWSGQASLEELTAARVEAWEYHDQRLRDRAKREVALVRLVICALFPGWEPGHLYDTIDVTLDYARDVGVTEEHLLRCLRRRFGDLVKQQ